MFPHLLDGADALGGIAGQALNKGFGRGQHLYFKKGVQRAFVLDSIDLYHSDIAGNSVERGFKKVLVARVYAGHRQKRPETQEILLRFAVSRKMIGNEKKRDPQNPNPDLRKTVVQGSPFRLKASVLKLFEYFCKIHTSPLACERDTVMPGRTQGVVP